MHRRIAFFLALLATLSSRDAFAKVRVVTTIQTFRALAEAVGGPHVTVDALVGEGVDPHYVDPRPSYALTLNKADLLVHVGLDLEKGWLPPLVEQSRNPRIQTGRPGNLEAGLAGVMVLDQGRGGTRAQGDIHPRGNPHFWLHPDNAEKVAGAIADRLAAIDPAHAGDYRKNLEAFRSRLRARRADWESRAKALRGVGVITYHKSWSYLTTWLGLDEIGYIETKPGVPPSPSHLANLVRTARARKGRLVVVESFYPRNTATRVARLAGMELVVLSPDAARDQDYFELVDSLLARLLVAQRT